MKIIFNGFFLDRLISSVNKNDWFVKLYMHNKKYTLNVYQYFLLIYIQIIFFYILIVGSSNELQWCFSQVKGTVEDEVNEGTIIIYLNIYV